MKQHLYGIEYGGRNKNDFGDFDFEVENFIMYTPEKFIAGLLQELNEFKNCEPKKGFYLIIGYMGEQDIDEEDLEEILDNGSSNWVDCKFEDGTFAVWKNENGDIVPLLPKEFTKFDTNRN